MAYVFGGGSATKYAGLVETNAKACLLRYDMPCWDYGMVALDKEYGLPSWDKGKGVCLVGMGDKACFIGIRRYALLGSTSVEQPHQSQ